MQALIFRICLLSFFFLLALKFGNRRNWRNYYPTILYVVVMNLATAFLTYHHVLWQYNQDILVKTHTTVEILNAFVVMPSVAFAFLSKLPFNKNLWYQYGYIMLWVLLFGSIEFLAHYVSGTLSYGNGWSWWYSIIFDIGMFSLMRLHHLKPIQTWGFSLLMAIVIVLGFGFLTGEYK